MGKIIFKLRDYLQEQDIKPSAVENRAQELGKPFGKNNIYRLMRNDGPENLSRTTLAVLIETLQSLSKGRRKVKLTDLVDYVED